MLLASTQVLRGGTIVPNPPLHVDVGGLPLWLTIKESAELNYKCMFATLADNQISVLQDPGSSLTAFEPIQTLPSGGLTPVFASLSLDQKFLLVANYNGNDDPAGAGVSVFRIESDCKLSRSDFAKHQGSSVDSSRQLAAHTHGVVVSSRRNIIYAFDLGMDVVFSYKFPACNLILQFFAFLWPVGSAGVLVFSRRHRVVFRAGSIQGPLSSELTQVLRELSPRGLLTAYLHRNRVDSRTPLLFSCLLVCTGIGVQGLLA